MNDQSQNVSGPNDNQTASNPASPAGQTPPLQGGAAQSTSAPQTAGGPSSETSAGSSSGGASQTAGTPAGGVPQTAWQPQAGGYAGGGQTFQQPGMPAQSVFGGYPTPQPQGGMQQGAPMAGSFGTPAYGQMTPTQGGMQQGVPMAGSFGAPAYGQMAPTQGGMPAAGQQFGAGMPPMAGAPAAGYPQGGVQGQDPFGAAPAGGFADAGAPPDPALKDYVFGKMNDDFKMNMKIPAHSLKFDEFYFMKLLAGSISLTKEEKWKIIQSIPKLRQEQIDELIRILEEEKEKFIELSPKHASQLKKLEEQHKGDWQDLEIREKQSQKTHQDEAKAAEIRKSLGL